MSQQGFFTSDEDFSADTPRDSLRNGCAACGLHRTKIHTPKMIPYLNNRLNDEENENADILFIGEAPGKNDDTQGFQFVDKSGRVLRAAIGNKAFFATNAVQCRPATKGKNRPPTEKEIGCCHRRVMVDIKRLQPKVIVPLGNVALKSLIGDRLSGPVYGINRWRGLQIPDQHYGAWICPTFHPSYVMREERNPVVSKIFKEDIDAAFDCVVKMFPRESLEEVKQQVTIYPDGKDVKSKNAPVKIHNELGMKGIYDQNNHFSKIQIINGHTYYTDKGTFSTMKIKLQPQIKMSNADILVKVKDQFGIEEQHMLDNVMIVKEGLFSKLNLDAKNFSES